jgi:hypothetical protein
MRNAHCNGYGGKPLTGLGTEDLAPVLTADQSVSFKDSLDPGLTVSRYKPHGSTGRVYSE